MVTEDQAFAALEYLRDYAGKHGALVGKCKGLEHRRKIVRSQAFLAASGGVAEREAKAEDSAEYRAIIQEIEDAETERATLATHMERARLTIQVWQTLSANARKV